MIKTEREKTREVRKSNILDSFQVGETFYTNQVAKKIHVVWPVADRLLAELVEEGRLIGDKVAGYRHFNLYKEEESWRVKIRRFFHISH